MKEEKENPGNPKYRRRRIEKALLQCAALTTVMYRNSFALLVDAPHVTESWWGVTQMGASNEPENYAKLQESVAQLVCLNVNCPSIVLFDIH